MKKFDCIILGGGASGIFTALNIDRNKKVALIEKSDRIGKKILVTGNGKCNLTNMKLNESDYNDKMVMEYFAKFNSVDTINYFNNLGLETYADNEGRVYPLSNSAVSVLDILLSKINSMQNISIVLDCEISKIKYNDKKFELYSDDEIYIADKLVIAVGGNNGVKYLQDLNVKYVGYTPSLVGLKTTKNKGLSGVRVSNVCVTANNFKDVGEVLFKEDGVSGIVIFNLSTILARNNLKTLDATIDLLPQYSYEQLKSILFKNVKHNPEANPVTVLEGLLHKAVAKNILDKLQITDINLQVFDKKYIDNVINKIKQFEIKIVGLSDNNQVYSGGIELKNLDDNLMSKEINNLYFTGEVVNVDGRCGGYNLQWAWTSGKIVGENI